MSARPGLIASSLRVFDFSFGQMLWSRRSVFLGLLAGAPVLMAAVVRVLALFPLGWAATAVMLVAVILFFLTL